MPSPIHLPATVYPSFQPYDVLQVRSEDRKRWLDYSSLRTLDDARMATARVWGAAGWRVVGPRRERKLERVVVLTSQYGRADSAVLATTLDELIRDLDPFQR